MNRFLHTIAMLALLVPSFAQAQSGGANVSNSPSLEIIGFYSLSADAAAYARFIQDKIASHDPANFPEEQKALFRRLDRGDSLHPFTDEDRQEWEEHLRHHMHDAAMFEVIVTNSGADFDIGKFVQPDPSQAKDFWQVAWNEKFLTPDGETVINLDRAQKRPDAPQYRVVFVIHFWKSNLPLRYGDRELTLPAQQPLPARLWRLAPYEVPD
jgi:hypothetical protein